MYKMIAAGQVKKTILNFEIYYALNPLVAKSSDENREMVNKMVVELTKWVAEGGEDEHRLEAAKRILTAYLDGSIRLCLSRLRLTSLPEAIGQLRCLTTLDLRYNQLETIPAELGQLTSLTVLSLKGNQLETVSAELVQLTSLTALNLSANQLETVLAELGQLTSLTVLSLKGNQLTILPPEIWQLTMLSELFLSSNKLTSVEGIGNLTRLVGLGVSKNQLKTLPTTLGQLKRLVWCGLSRNFLPPTESDKLPEHMRAKGVGEQKTEETGPEEKGTVEAEVNKILGREYMRKRSSNSCGT